MVIIITEELPMTAVAAAVIEGNFSKVVLYQ